MRKIGRFGEYGGRFVPEVLIKPLYDVSVAFEQAMNDPEFLQQLAFYSREYAGRPSLLTYAEKMTRQLGGAKIYLKREDLNHTGSHKINNVLGQALLAKRMNKKKLIAETGAGQHGVAAATAAALFDMKCRVFMGKEDIDRQELNVFRMKLLGAEVIPVSSGTATLKDATTEAIGAWAADADDTFYLLGSAVGPHPYPSMVREFQSVIGKEIRRQILEKEGKLPSCIVACVGGGSNAIGAFADFIDEPSVRLVGAEAAGKGVDTALHAATLTAGEKGVFHGFQSIFLQDDHGGIQPVYSISAGLDYPGVGPEHAHLHQSGRAQYFAVTDAEAVDAFAYLTKTEGIIPALESSHAVAQAIKMAPKMQPEEIMVVVVSGRGDKDVQSVADYMGVELK